MEIRRLDGEIIGSGINLREVCAQNKTDLSRANLSRANLSRANLFEANLFEANLFEADLSGANLSRANLSRANLFEANLFEADLSGANLFEADLSGANLSGANLHRADLFEANLFEADLSGANLSGAKVEFYQFPSIRLLSSIHLGNLPSELQTELMRRDAWAHPYPERFNEWANGGSCPYQNEERFWDFDMQKNNWECGSPQMRDSDLILAICKAKNWGIKGFLDLE